MTTATPGVVGAAFRALAAWLVIYAILSQLLVIPKWRSSSLSSLTTEEEQAVPGEPPEATAPTTTIQDVKEQERRIQIIQRLVNDAKEVESQHERVVASTIEQLKGMYEKVMKPLSKGEDEESDNAKVTFTSPDLAYFQELMELPTLSNVDETRLLELSERMQSEVDATVRTNATISWSEVSEIVTARYPRESSSSSSSRDCRQQQDDDTAPTIDPSLARESHLYQKFQQTEKLLKRRAESMPPLLWNSDRIVTELLEQASSSSSSSIPHVGGRRHDDDDDRICVSQDDVMNMMDEGINALHRRLDVRQALTRFLLANYDDMNESDLILDAPFLDPPRSTRRPTTTVPSSVQTSDSVNLRHVVDTPLLKKVAEWVDVALDHVGGHVDSLDQLVDSLAADDTSVGRVLVTKLQTLAGKVELPNAWAKVPSRAGILQPGH